MKANVRFSVLSLLLVLGCNRPDSELFGDNDLPPSESESGTGGGPTAGGT